MLTETDLHSIQEIVNRLVGLRAWEVALDEESDVGMKFGIPELPDEDGDIGSEWELYLLNCHWRLQTEDEVLVASGDDGERIAEGIKRMQGVAIEKITVTAPSLDTTILFEGQLTLRLFPVYAKHRDHWWLFTPENYFLRIGPGSAWSFEDNA